VVAVSAGVLLDRNGRLLLHRRPAGTHHAGRWEFPGGKQEAGETPKGALLRELSEELGIAASAPSLRLAGIVESAVPGRSARKERRRLRILLFTVRRWRGAPRALEGGRLRWCRAATVAALDLAPLDRLLLPQLLQSLRR